MARVGAPDKTLAELLAAVHADPSDLAARAVYADALQQVGDPRGEFIALQLRRKRTEREREREKELLRQHRNAWLGPLAPLLGRSSSRFENGFLRTAALASAKRWTSLALDEPELRTVESLDVVAAGHDGIGHTSELLVRLPKLRELTLDGLAIGRLEERVKQHPLRRLSVRLPSLSPLLGLLHRRTFTELRELRVWNVDPGPDALVRLVTAAAPLDLFECDLAGGTARDAIAIGKLANIVPALLVTGPWGQLRVARAEEKLAITPLGPRRDAHRIDSALDGIVAALGRDRVSIVRR